MPRSKSAVLSTERSSRNYAPVSRISAGCHQDGSAAVAALVRAGKKNALTTAGLTQNAGFAGVNGAFRLKRDGTNERGLAVMRVGPTGGVIAAGSPKSFGA